MLAECWVPSPEKTSIPPIPEVLMECKTAGENLQKQCLFMHSSAFLLEM